MADVIRLGNKDTLEFFSRFAKGRDLPASALTGKSKNPYTPSL